MQSTTRPFWIAAGLTLLLYALPFGSVLAAPLLWLSTYAHEMGHGLGAWLAGGSFRSFCLWWDGSGMAATSGVDWRLGQVLVLAGGLMGPAVLAACLFWAARVERRSRRCLGLLGLLVLASVVFLVRNGFGVVFCAALGLALLAFARDAWAHEAQIALIFLGQQLALSVFSRSDYLFMKVAQTSGGTIPSDAAKLAEVLGGPYWLWGGVVGLLSIGVLGLGLASLRRKRP